MTRMNDVHLRPRTSSRLREAVTWAGERSLRSRPDGASDEKSRNFVDVADGVTVRVGAFDIVLW